jgi:hypothetical protein
MVNITGYYMVFMMVKNNLVGGIPTPLKNDGVRQWEGLSHILWKIKFMFETLSIYLVSNSYVTIVIKYHQPS